MDPTSANIATLVCLIYLLDRTIDATSNMETMDDDTKASLIASAIIKKGDNNE